MGSPITIGALSTTAPPGDARSARGKLSSHDRADLDDRALIDAVRAGNLHAFGTLYERHVGVVRGLARRLCGNPTDADDVVADVFTNTLRAIKRGRGPQDDMRSYVLTSTRHTVIKLRTRRDSGRAVPTIDEQLDKPVTDELLGEQDTAETIGAAFVQLPDRFRNVLWLSCVEGMPSAEVGERTALSSGAASSLTLRARRALARAYLVSCISQPVMSADCLTIRDLLPSIIRDEAAAATISRVDGHLVACHECCDAFEEMQSLAGSMRTFPWLAAAVAWLRSAAVRLAPEAIGGLGGAGAAAPVLVAAMAMIVAGNTAASASHASVSPRTETSMSSTQVAVPVSAAVDPVVLPSTTAVATSPVVDPVESPPTRDPAITTGLRERGVSNIAVAIPFAGPGEVVGEVVDPVDEVVANELGQIDEIVTGVAVPITAALDDTVEQTLDTVDRLGQQLAGTTEQLAGTTEQLLDEVDQTVVGVLEGVGAEQLAATVEPVLDTTTELVTTEVVEPVTEVVGDTVLDTTTLVTSTTNGLLGLSPRH